MLKALDEAGVKPDLILGTSIGAFNGSVVAEQPGTAGVERLQGLWEDISSSGLMIGSLFERARSVAMFRPAMQQAGGLRSLLQDVHGPDSRIEDLAVPFQCVAASIERAAEYWFDRGPLVEALLASSAIPALFPPVEIDGEHFYDGGLVNSVPLARAVELGASRVFVLQVGRMESDLRPPRRLHEAALVSFEIARRHRFTSTMASLPAGIEVHVLPSGNVLDFDDRRQLRWSELGDTDALVAAGYRASVDYLQGL
jgi:NTE family protein